MAAREPPRWPYTSAICPVCRSLTLGPTHCGQVPLELARANHVDALADRVWGPPVAPPQKTSVAVGGWLGAGAVFGFVTMFGALALREPSADDIRAVGVPAMALLGLGGLALGMRAHGRRRIDAPARRVGGVPSGGEVPARGASTPGVSGVIEAGPALASPLSGRSCVAYSAVLTRGAATMLRAAATVGFSIETSDGERIAVPAGDIAMTTDGGVVVDDESVQGFLVSGLPVIAGPDGEPLFLHDHAVETILAAGDHVTIYSDVRDGADGTPETVLYVDSTPPPESPR